MSKNDFYDLKQTKNQQTLSLHGDWNVQSLTKIQKHLSGAQLTPDKKLIIDGKGLTDFDTVAAVLLQSTFRKKQISLAPRHFEDSHQQIWDLVDQNYTDPPAPPQRLTGVNVTIAKLGHSVIDFKDMALYTLSTFGEFVYNLIQIGAGKQTMRTRSIAFHINEIGIRALPVIFLMAFSIALVMGYQGATQLRNFGASIYTIDLVAISVLREMGVLLTAIMVAGRTGSAFAAQIGTMKLNEEIAALQTMGVSPFNALALPRLVAIFISLPILTFLANIVALAGVYVYVHAALDISLTQFLNRIDQVITPSHFWAGMIKAPVFALIIGLIGCMQGMQVRSSAEDVGKHTTKAVVQSIFSIIVMDAIFSILFTKVGI